MPYKDFTDVLTQLQSQNLGAGFVMQAQVEALKRQDQATINTLALFNQSKSNLDNELRTTDEQLKEIEASDVFGEGTQKLEEMATQYEAIINASLIRQQKITDLYQSTARDLTQIGSEESREIANQLSQDLPIQLQIEQDRSRAPVDKLKFMGLVNQLTVGRLDIEQRKIELDQIKQDIEVMDAVGQIVADENSKWGELPMYLNRNSDTGRIQYNEKKKQFMEYLYTTFKNDKNLSKIATYFDSLIESRVKDFNPPEPRIGGYSSGMQGILEKEGDMFRTYEWLKNTSAYIDHVETSPEFSSARDFYNRTALAILTEKGIDATSPQAQRYLYFGSNVDVLNRMKQQEAMFGDAAKTINFQGGYSSPTDIATWMYQVKYDTDPENENYYPRHYQNLKDYVIPGSVQDKRVPIEPLQQLSEGQVLALKNSNKLSEAEQMYGRYYKPTVYGVQTTQGTVAIDFSQLLSFESKKWWNPHRVSDRMKYVETEQEALIRAKREKEIKQYKAKQSVRDNIPDLGIGVIN